jgi:aminoglycoside phosphotransferase (APT) family kinase protein
VTTDHVIEVPGPARPTAATTGGADAVRPLAGLLREPGTRVAVLATSKDVNAKVTLMVVPPGHDRPAAVVKVATTRQAAGAVLAEEAALRALHATGAPIVAATVPRPLARYDADGLPAVASTAMPGRPLRTTYHQWRHTARRSAVRRDFALAADWLAELQQQTAGEWAGSTLLADALAELVRRFPADPRAERAADRLGRCARDLAAVGVPVTAVHGDYWHGNLLAGPGGICAVVDWEAGTAAGDPVRDVVRFPLGYALYLDRHTRPGRAVAGHPGLRAGGAGGGVGYAVLGNGWFPELVRENVTAALDRLGVPARWWRVVLLAGIAEIAVTADHPDFAEQHLDLLDRLARRCTDAGLLP